MTLPCIVHLDLKGAPWRLDYLYKVLSFIKAHGAWGVLIEWEDTFPYTSELTNIGSNGGCGGDGLYSHDEVKRILQCCKEFGLEVIQLIQTIGHMEFVLKHGQYQHLRELALSPAVLCPSKPESLTLVQALVSQLMEAQPGARYLHIGADEAWHMNVCSDCQRRSSTTNHGAASLYLEHIAAIASYVKERYPQVCLLMWDDMMRNIPAELLKVYKIGELVTPVIWNYSMKEHFQLDSLMWHRYSQIFPRVWAASAFKGANGSCQMLCSAKRYASNQVAWRDEINALKGNVAFEGIILTGWSRFDHYATLCELLPVALPSLASCLKMWTRPDGFTIESVISEHLPLESWPGFEMVVALQTAVECKQRCLAFLDGDQIATWLNPWQIEHNYVSPMQAENIAITAKHLSSELESCRGRLSSHLHLVTGRRSSEELLHTWLAAERRLADVTSAATRALTHVTATCAH